jgi:hypothetical protein
MGRFASLRLSTKLTLLVAIFLVGLLAFTAVAWQTLSRVKVNGPLYHDIVQGKDVIADVLPPPEYIIESYLIVLQMVEEQDKGRVAAYIERGKKLRGEYEERHAFWIDDLPAGRLKDFMVTQSYRPAMDFYEIRDREFVPAILGGDHARARELAHGKLQERYDEHRKAVDEVVRLATAQNLALEKTATELVSSSTATLIGLAGLIVALVLWTAWLIVRSLVSRLQRSSVVEAE